MHRVLVTGVLALAGLAGFPGCSKRPEPRVIPQKAEIALDATVRCPFCRSEFQLREAKMVAGVQGRILCPKCKKQLELNALLAASKRGQPR